MLIYFCLFYRLNHTKQHIVKDMRKMKIKFFFMEHERLVMSLFGILILTLTALRFINVFHGSSFVDQKIMTVTAELITKHISPYMSPEYDAYHFPGLPIQSPSVSIFMMPLLLLPPPCRFILMFVLNIAAVGLSCFLVVRKYDLFKGKSPLSPCYGNLLVWIFGFLVLQSSPMLTMLRHGQMIGIVLLLTVLFLLFPAKEKYNWLYLGLAAILKYSLLFFTAPLLVLQKRIRICFAGFALFLLFLLLPGLWLDGIRESLMDYINLLLENTRSGNNSYAQGSSFCMVQFDFWRFSILNLIGKLLLFSAFIYMLIRSRRRLDPAKDRGWIPSEFRVPELCLITSASLCILYHRNYDGVLFLPFLLAICLQSIRYGNKAAAAVNILFLLFWAAPMGAVYAASNFLGARLSFLNSAIYFSTYQNWQHIFPLSNIVLFAMVLWFFLQIMMEKKLNVEETNEKQG